MTVLPENAAPLIVPRHQMSPASGCLAKIDGLDLTRIVDEAFRAVPGAGVAPTANPEDCAVIGAVADPLLLTTDFGPLVGPDMLRAGRIAATHAMSDVYAMGGRPLVAVVMLIVDSGLPDAAASEVEAGLLAACQADGAAVVGGHTVEGQEAMAGLTVLGTFSGSPLTKRGARPGDVIMLSKPLGTGLVVRAYQQGLVDSSDLDEALAIMELSNFEASRLAVAGAASAVTDVTGFGLLGHLAELLAGDRIGAILDLHCIPVLSAAADLPESFGRTRFIEGNMQYCLSKMPVTGISRRSLIRSLLDPQTSGGLLVLAPPTSLDDLRKAGFWAIGHVTDEHRLEIR